MVGWKEVHKQHPFGILEIGRVGLGEFGHSPILPDYLRNTLLAGLCPKDCYEKAQLAVEERYLERVGDDFCTSR
jgi:hypothetical protein